MTVSLVPMAELRAWCGQDLVVRAEATPETDLPALAFREGSAWAVAFLRPTHTHGLSLMLRGDDGSGMLATPRIRAALEGLVASAPFAGWVGRARAKGADAVSLPRAQEGLGGLLAEVHGRWEWMCTAVTVAAEPVAGLVDIGEDSREEVLTLLQEHNPGTDGQPFARPGQRWVGVREGDDGLLAAGCCEVERSGAPVLAGITVAPAARGRGLARAVTAELTRAAVTEHGWCTLGMYSNNGRARGIYRSLGYEVRAEWSSGRLA